VPLRHRKNAIAVKTKRDPIWLVPVIIVGLLVTLAWGGFLIWVVYRVIQVM
jgi:prepilin signal peptidase PulO-like enzyme (type II secretory pathway)